MGYYLLDRVNTVLQYAYPRRGGSKPSGTIIVHTAECAMDLAGADDSAENCASFIAGRSDYGSYHRLVDSDSVIKMLPFNYEAWQDTETNGWGIGISAAVQAGKWNTIPADRRDRIYRNLAKAAAEAVEYMRATYGVNVPIKRISGAQARAGVPGFCAHGDSGIHRSDPGAQFDWDLFFTYTNQELGRVYAASVIEKDWFDMATEADLKKVLMDGDVLDAIAFRVQAYKGTGKRDSWSYTVNNADDAAYKTVREHIKVTDWSNKEKVDAQLAAFIGTIWNQTHRNAPKQFKEIIARLGSLEAGLSELADGGDMAAVAEASKEGARKALEEWEQANAQEIAIAVVDEQAERLAPKEEAK